MYRAPKIAKVMGDERLSWRELMDMVKALKSKVHPQWSKGNRRDDLRVLLNIATLLPERNRKPLIRFVVDEYIRIGELRSARDVVTQSLPEVEWQIFAWCILIRQLSDPCRYFDDRDVLTTEKLLGRRLSKAEVLRRLELGSTHSFYSLGEWRELIMRLPEDERAPHLEKYLANQIRQYDFSGAKETASLLSRNLTFEEVAEILTNALSSRSFNRSQIRSDRRQEDQCERVLEDATLYLLSTQ